MKRKQAIEELGLSYVAVYEFAKKRGDFDMSIFPVQIDLAPTKITASFIERYRSLWPKQSETGLPYAVTSPSTIITQRFNNLLKNWDDLFDQEFSEELLLDTTRRYLAHQRENNWVMTKKSHKFIWDENGSLLADWVNNKKKPSSTTFFA